MIKVEQRKREREIFVNNIYISPIPTSVLAPLLPFPSFPLIFARPFIHFLSFSLLIAVSLFLFLFASLYRSRNSTCASTPELYVRNRKRKVEKKMIVHLFIQLFSYIYIYIYIYIYEIFIGYLDETLYLFRREYIGHGRNTIRRRDAITHITFTTNEPGDSFGR